MRNYRVISDGCARDLVSETAQRPRIRPNSAARLCGAKTRCGLQFLGLFELESQSLGLLLPVVRQGCAHDQIGGQMGGRSSIKDGALEIRGQKRQGDAGSGEAVGTVFRLRDVAQAFTFAQTSWPSDARARFCCRTGSGWAATVPVTSRV